MLRTLVQLGPVTISSLGLLTALGFIFGSFIYWQKAREEHFEEEYLMDSAFLIVLVGFVTSRLGFVAGNLSQFDKILEVLDLVGKPGFSWHGALIGGILTLVLYCSKRKWDFFKVADLGCFGVLLALIFEQLGLFLSSFNWWELLEAGFLVIGYQLLTMLDKNYRTYEWYKNKRGETSPGFLLFTFLIITCLIQLSFGIINSFPQVITPLFVSNLIIILVSLGFIYFRTGQSLTITKRSFTKLKGVNEGWRYKAGMEANK